MDVGEWEEEILCQDEHCQVKFFKSSVVWVKKSFAHVTPPCMRLGRCIFWGICFKFGWVVKKEYCDQEARENGQLIEKCVPYLLE